VGSASNTLVIAKNSTAVVIAVNRFIFISSKYFLANTDWLAGCVFMF
jgi:hypothetical protein